MRAHQILLLLILVSAAPGCVHMHPTQSGFLSDYSQLEPIGKKERLQVRPVNPVALKNVDSFYVEPVAWLADDMGQPANSEGAEAAISEKLHESLVEQLSCIRPVVDEIGPRTAIVRSAVTGVRESQPFVNAILVFQIVGPLFNGGASAEIEVIDPNGTQIAAESVAYRGHGWDILGFFWTRRHPESAVRRAAEQLTDDLEAADEEEVELELSTSSEPGAEPQPLSHPPQESFRLVR